MSGAGKDSKQRWTAGIRLLTNQIPRAAVRMTLTYRVHPRLQLGLEYNPRAHEVAPLANLLVLTETKRRPALMLGTSSDRIGTPSGQSFYATFSKNLRRETGCRFRVCGRFVGTTITACAHRRSQRVPKQKLTALAL